ncbi:MAG: YebC/PmpR family DNA-binding transcriptional regulator [Deltaproteobacteria bacterium]|nr:YebC/PmpR family DNA-binding transcriptional regulator [Deltaproteobacteria bacterium]
MSGHSKWATIKRKKGAADAKRGQIFTKLIKAITVAARMGGGDPNGNPRLRKAVDDAKAQSMPIDNINRAIKKGTGELEGVSYEDITYEAYGPAGVAVMIESLTDNKNRTVSELRNILSKNNGNMGESGSVAWVFEKKGVFYFDKNQFTEDQLMEVALEAGADDVQSGESDLQISCDPASYEQVKSALDQAKLAYSSSEVGLIPKNYIKLEEADAAKMLRLMEALEDHDDVQHVYANFDIADDIMEKLNQ